MPDLCDIEAAAQTVYAAFGPTPQYRWTTLSERLGTDCWVKHENHTPVGAFKVRAGLTYLEHLKQTGTLPQRLVSATRGNDGQSLAYASARHGETCTIVVPMGNSIEKNRAMRALGAQVIEHGRDFQAAREHAQQVADQTGAHFVSSYHPALVRGVATYWWEFLRAVPQLDVLYVPIGLGSGTCAAFTAKHAWGHGVRVVGVIGAHATTYADAIAARRVVQAEVSTVLADGLAVRRVDPQALAHPMDGLDHTVQVSDSQVAQAMRDLFDDSHNVAERAGAASFAAAWSEREALRGQVVGTTLCGGKVDAAVLARVLQAEH